MSNFKSWIKQLWGEPEASLTALELQALSFLYSGVNPQLLSIAALGSTLSDIERDQIVGADLIDEPAWCATVRTIRISQYFTKICDMLDRLDAPKRSSGLMRIFHEEATFTSLLYDARESLIESDWCRRLFRVYGKGILPMFIVKAPLILQAGILSI